MHRIHCIETMHRIQCFEYYIQQNQKYCIKIAIAAGRNLAIFCIYLNFGAFPSLIVLGPMWPNSELKCYHYGMTDTQTLAPFRLDRRTFRKCMDIFNNSRTIAVKCTYSKKHFVYRRTKADS